MKKIYHLLFLATLLFTGCVIIEETESSIDGVVNKLQINGVQNEITFGEMVAYDKLPANTNFSFKLLLHTGTTSAVYQPEWSYTGIGSYFSFTLWSEDSTIASGSYIIDGFVQKSFSITRASAELNVDWSTGESDFGSYLDGNVQIVNMGDGTYEININCTDYEGNLVTAYYKGEFYYLKG